MTKDKTIDAEGARAGILRIWMARTSRGNIDNDRLNMYCNYVASLKPSGREWESCVAHFVDTSGFFPQTGEIREVIAKERARGFLLLRQAQVLAAEARKYQPWTPEQKAESLKFKALCAKIGRAP